MSRTLTILLLTAALLLPQAGRAKQLRVALLLGSNLGVNRVFPLKYAETDAQKVGAALIYGCGFTKDAVFSATTPGQLATAPRPTPAAGDHCWPGRDDRGPADQRAGRRGSEGAPARGHE